MPLRHLLDPGDWLGMKPRIDPDAAPIRFQFQPDPGEIKLRIGVGLLVSGAASIAIYLLWGDLIPVIVAAGFGMFGLLNLIYAILQRRFAFSLAISNFEVAVDKQTLFGRRDWRERISAYQGILLREEEFTEQTSGKMTRVKRYHIVELLHEDAAKTVPLWVVEDGSAPVEIQRAFGRRLNLPLLTPDGGGVARADRGLRAPDPGPPPEGVLVREEGEVICFQILPRRPGKSAAVLLWLLIPVLIGGFLYQIDPEFGLIAGGMTAALFVFLIVVDLFAKRGAGQPAPWLCLSRQALWIGPPESPGRLAVPLDTIRQVRVDSYWSRNPGSAGRRARLVVDGGNTRLEFGAGRSGELRMRWIRDRVLHRISRRA